MTITELRQECESLERDGWGHVPVHVYDGTGKFVELQADQIVGDGEASPEGLEILWLYICSPEAKNA